MDPSMLGRGDTCPKTGDPPRWWGALGPAQSGSSHACEDCDRAFPTAAELRGHQQGAHALRKPHRCAACGRAFALRSSLQLHERAHCGGPLPPPPPAVLPCPCPCPRRAWALRRHRRRERRWRRRRRDPRAPADEGPYACARCGRAFGHKAVLLFHQQGGCGAPLAAPSPPPAGPLHSCGLCARAFQTPAGLSAHLRRFHPAERARRQAYCCPSCKRAFQFSSSFVHHKCGRADAGLQLLPCQLCPEVFLAPGGLREHIILSHGPAQGGEGPPAGDGKQGPEEEEEEEEDEPAPGPKPKGFPCRSCDKVFALPSALCAHRKLHQRKTAAAAAAAGRERKRKVSGRPDVPKVFPCRFCSRVFLQGASRSQHTQLQHGGARGQGCPACGASFQSRAQLLAHQRRPGCRDQARIYQCPLCDKAYRHLSNLCVHKRSHVRLAWERKRRGGGEPEGGGPGAEGGLLRCSVCSLGIGHARAPRRRGGAWAWRCRPFHCLVCSRTFSALGVFLKHCERHLGRGGSPARTPASQPETRARRLRP